ncbi:MAG: hypothetical protein AAF388_02695 [Bacteroidota bacterium]
MSVLEMKNLLHKFIANSNDEQMLQVLLMMIQEQNQEVLEWESLPENVQQSIRQGIAQLDSGEGKSHAQLVAKYKKWL